MPAANQNYCRAVHQTRSFSLVKLVSQATAALCAVAFIFSGSAFAYEKATEGDMVVRGKLNPKSGRVELNADFGLIMNQAYIDTYLLHGSINYYFSELWGFGIEGMYGINSDKGERTCIENFYNNPKRTPGPSCPDDTQNTPPAEGNFGPAYVPIREINAIINVNGIYNPVYGKQLLLLSSVAHFDMFVTIGAGIAMSDYYPKSQTTRADGDGRGRPTRDAGSASKPGENPAAGENPTIGCTPTNGRCYGEDGRPDPIQETTPLINLGVGQKIHFSKMFNIKFELRNMTLFGGEAGFENLFAVWGGAALRF
jgi:outer membrane beta-barrel protein